MKPARTTATRASARTHILYTRLPLAPSTPLLMTWEDEEGGTQWHCDFHSFRRLYDNNTFIQGESMQPLPLSRSHSGADEIKHRDFAVSKCTS